MRTHTLKESANSAMLSITTIAAAFLVCAGCAVPNSGPDDLQGKTEQSLRGVWESQEFATSDWEFAHYTNLTVYVYRVGKLRTNTEFPIKAEILGAFVYKDRVGQEHRRYPMQLATGNRICVGEFMGSICPHYSFKNGSLILEIENSSSPNYFRARLHKTSSDPGDPERLLPLWLIQSQEEF